MHHLPQLGSVPETATHLRSIKVIQIIPELAKS